MGLWVTVRQQSKAISAKTIGGIHGNWNFGHNCVTIWRKKHFVSAPITVASINNLAVKVGTIPAGSGDHQCPLHGIGHLQRHYSNRRSASLLAPNRRCCDVRGGVGGDHRYAHRDSRGTIGG
jgi:hypothetical protein